MVQNNFYITNLQGDVIELRDMSGSVVVKYKYDAWGNIFYQSPGTLADINPYRYRGYRYDVETGYYYLQSRYYNPQIGRFISADGLVGETGNLLTQNMYAYSFNNPVMYSDISGEFPVLLTKLVVAYAIWTVVDLCKVFNGVLSFDEETGNLNNSNKVQNPSVIFGYSLYMKYASDYKDYFEGSAGGIAAEWIWHNTLFDGSVVLSKLGIDSMFGVSVSDINNSAKTAGFGSSVFRDTIDNQSRPEVVYPSLVIEGLISPVSLVYDFYKEYVRRD